MSTRAIGAARVFRAWTLALLLLAGIGAMTPAVAQIADINSAINKAGRQRMLSQRIAKTYLQLGLKVDVERATPAMDSAIALFDRQLVELKNYAPTPAIRQTYQQLETEWIAYKDLLLGAAPSTEGARKVMEASDRVLELAHKGTTQLVEHSGTEVGPLVGVAGRQRMLSQRMAKFYLLQLWGVGGTAAASEQDKARRAFVMGLKALSDAPSTSAEIKAELERARGNWNQLDTALAQREGGDRNVRGLAVATASERVLIDMDVITGLFEKLKQ